MAAIELLRVRIRTRHYSIRTEDSCADWCRRFLEYLTEQQRAPSPIVNADAVRNVLTYLAVNRRVSASTQNQAFSAVLFLCREILGVDAGHLNETPRAKRSEHLPVVLSVPEVTALLSELRRLPRLMASLVYGGGLRVSECCELRIEDVDFDQGLVVVRGGKGSKDRTTLLPQAPRGALRAQLERCEELHAQDRAAGVAGVWLPDALDRKYPNAGREFGWFWVFPSGGLSTDPRAGVVRRHHVSESTHVVKELRTPARSPLDLLG